MNPSDDTSRNASEPCLDPAAPADAFAFTLEEMEEYRRQLAKLRKALAQNGGRPRLHVLIVDDQAFSRKLLHQMLNQACSVSAATSVADGWTLYIKEAPDIIFLDIELPGVSGHVLADKIKILDPCAYVVMVTSSQDVYDLQMAKQNRVDGFILKPFNKQKIDACINRYRAAHKTPAETRRTS